MNGNGKIIDPRVDAAVQQAMQQQIQLAIVQFELRDRMAMVFLSKEESAPYAACTDEECARHETGIIRRSYRLADLMLRIRQEKPSDPPLPAES